MSFKGSKEMVSIGTGEKLDTEVVDGKGEGGRLGVVAPDTRGDGDGRVTEGS